MPIGSSHKNNVRGTVENSKAKMCVTCLKRPAFVEHISQNGITTHPLVAVRNLCMEAVVAMAIASVHWKSVKQFVFTARNCIPVAMTQLFLTKLMRSMLILDQRNRTKTNATLRNCTVTHFIVLMESSALWITTTV